VGKDLLEGQVWMEINFTVGMRDKDIEEKMSTADSG
jgi:hypothetical protein